MSQHDEIWNLPSDADRLVEHVDVSGRDVVDVGCGAGGLVRFLRHAGASVTGVECGEAMIGQARENDPEHASAYIEGVGQDLPLDSESVDLVVFSYSLHHVPADQLSPALAEAARVLRPGGQLAVLEPIPSGPGFITHQLVDDETEVRALAQAALDNAPTELVEVSAHKYTTSYSYLDMAELEKTVVDIDPSRRVAFDANRGEVERRFAEQSELHGGRHWFSQPVIMRVFAK